MHEREQRLLVAATALTSVLLLAAALAGHAELVAYAVPLCVVVLPLVAGRYLGEDALERLRERATGQRRPRVAVLSGGGARPALAPFPRGGRLIAQALAERAPPARALI